MVAGFVGLDKQQENDLVIALRLAGTFWPNVTSRNRGPLDAKIAMNRVQYPFRNRIGVHGEDWLGGCHNHLSKRIDVYRVIPSVRLEATIDVKGLPIGEHQVQTGESTVFGNGDLPSGPNSLRYVPVSASR